jgi:hypothetical protein
VNPVIELSGAPKGALTMKKNGRVLSLDSYAWDGHVLWINSLIDTSTELDFEFEDPKRGDSLKSPKP